MVSIINLLSVRERERVKEDGERGGEREMIEMRREKGKRRKERVKGENGERKTIGREWNRSKERQQQSEGGAVRKSER